MPNRKKGPRRSSKKAPVPESRADQAKAVIAQDASPEDEFPRRLAALREAKGLRHDTLSELTKIVDQQKRGIARTTLRGYEYGEYKPGIRELRILSQALGVTPNELIFGLREFDPFDASAHLTPAEGMVLGIPRALVQAWAQFGVAMFNADNPTRETVFKVAHDLVRARLGPVDYERIMGATREIFDTYVDDYLDRHPDGGAPTPEEAQQVIKRFFPIILGKYGFKPVTPEGQGTPDPETKPKE